jgi:hypothetical protein
MSSSPGSSWTKADDDFVWKEFGHLPRNASGGISTAGVSAHVAAVASHFNRTSGAITSRMKHLDDPTHFAHTRLNGGSAGAAIKVMEGAGKSSDGSVTLSPKQAAAVRKALQGL